MRRRLKHTSNADLYEFKRECLAEFEFKRECLAEFEFKRECLAEFEQLSEQGYIDLFYGDESGVSLLPCVPYACALRSVCLCLAFRMPVPCVPYAWQFADEQVVMPSERGGSVNCFALISRELLRADLA